MSHCPTRLRLREAACYKIATAPGPPRGKRNATLNREAFGLGTLLSAGPLDFERTWWNLHRAAWAAGIDDDVRALRAALKSGLLAGIAAHPPTDLAALLNAPESFIRRFDVFPSEHELGHARFDADPFTALVKNLTTLRVEVKGLFHGRNVDGARRIAAT